VRDGVLALRRDRCGAANVFASPCEPPCRRRSSRPRGRSLLDLTTGVIIARVVDALGGAFADLAERAGAGR